MTAFSIRIVLVLKRRE